MLCIFIGQHALQNKTHLISIVLLLTQFSPPSNKMPGYYNSYYINQLMLKIFICICVFAVASVFAFHEPTDKVSTPQTDLDIALEGIRQNRHLMGIQLEITNKTHILYHGNFGSKDSVKPIQNSTMFRIASCSKSVAAAAVMLLVEQKKVALNQTLSSVFGFPVKNPAFPTIDITVQMALSHQSSLVECDPYYSNFLTDTYNAQTGTAVPKIKQILTQGGRYYNKCLFNSVYPPGAHFQYTNLNFGIAGAIVEIASGIRFDIFLRERILKHISVGLPEVATFYSFTISNPDNLGILFTGSNGKWVPSYDYYPDGKIPQRNLSGYVIGSNGVIFGPQGGLRASASHLSNYITMIANKGVTKQGTRVLSEQSAQQMIRPRYHYHGSKSGSQNDFHQYGLGLYTTTYRKNDIVIPHEVVRGHTGSAYGLISGYYFWGNYTMTYIVNGALNGYGYGTGTIYQRERLLIYDAVTKYVNALNPQNY